MVATVPESGHTSENQTSFGYCLECLEGHILAAVTETRHAVERFNSSRKMTRGVVEKIRVVLAEVQGIDEDIGEAEAPTPEAELQLKQILDASRWIRKNFGLGGIGLTIGKGTEADLKNLRKQVLYLQKMIYNLASLEG